jgi:DNA-binding response OmpR family regulator
MMQSTPSIRENTEKRVHNRILITEDDPVIAKQTAEHLKSWGCEVCCTEDFNDVLGDVRNFQPDLVLMDISLPFFNGYHWCQEIRKFSNIPVIFISSYSENMNIVMAMNMGGDDFIAKPFDLNVLTAKIQALLRRTYDFSMPSESETLSVRGVTLDLRGASAEILGQKADLTKNEFRILEALMKTPGKVVNRDQIMMALWETDSFIDDNTLTVNVTRLRKKLASYGLKDFIKTKKGLGYVIPENDASEKK